MVTLLLHGMVQELVIVHMEYSLKDITSAGVMLKVLIS
jgi:hypothetical protein